MGHSVIRLVGPGGSGKSTVGAALASRLDLPFIDLDVRFMERAGDISRYIDRLGYAAYARENLEVYWSCLDGSESFGIIALSSGFMTYPRPTHPGYDVLREEIGGSPTTFVLLPSLDREVCVAETVRRQVARPFGRSPEREEAVIRERHLIYMALPAQKVETIRPVAEVVDEIEAALPSAFQWHGNNGPS
jgi:shikimate kinase